MTVRSILRLWFSFDATVNRRAYLASALALGVLKYAGDAALVYFTSGRIWHLWDYLGPVGSLGATKIDFGGEYLLPALAVWSLPFLWIGVSLSMRRALDAGWSAWMALFFFVPLMNYVLLAFLSALPTDRAERSPTRAPSGIDEGLPRALSAIGVAVAIGVSMLLFSVYLLEDYGAALFFGTPFVMGAVSAYRYNRPPTSMRATAQITGMSLLIVAGILVLTAAEGAVCLLMAAPIALVVGLMGAYLGRRIAMQDPNAPSRALIGILMLPSAATMESLLSPPIDARPLREVVSSVVINAPADVVWRNVIAFPEIPAPRDLFFRSGVSYPIRAEIRGSGVGAVRYCVFSTGPFVEPITRWEPGHRLSFNVDSQPRPLNELSPYANVTPPHLDGYLVSRRGEFRLVALSPTQTRLEGSTWYQMRLAPEAYWGVFGDLIIHRIHMRVLEHISRTATETATAL